MPSYLVKVQGSDHMTASDFTSHDIIGHWQNRRQRQNTTSSNDMTRNDITQHHTSQITTLTHHRSPHNQPHYFLSITQPTSWHQTTSLQSTWHHNHGTAEGTFTPRNWFGHRAGRSPCALSIGKFFLCYIVLFPFETSAPGSHGNYLYYIVVQTCRPTRTRTDKNVAACFPRVRCMRRSQGNWRPLDSECLILRYLKDSGTKILAFQCEGRRYEDRGSAQICLLTVDSHSNSKCQACKVCVQCQSSISCGAEVLAARHLICAFFFACQICIASL